MPRDELADLIPGTTSSDYIGEYAQSLDMSGDACLTARMVTLQQLAQLFNLLLGKSKVKNKLDCNLEDTRIL